MKCCSLFARTPRYPRYCHGLKSHGGVFFLRGTPRNNRQVLEGNSGSKVTKILRHPNRIAFKLQPAYGVLLLAVSVVTKSGDWCVGGRQVRSTRSRHGIHGINFFDDRRSTVAYSERETPLCRHCYYYYLVVRSTTTATAATDSSTEQSWMALWTKQKSSRPVM